MPLLDLRTGRPVRAPDDIKAERKRIEAALLQANRSDPAPGGLVEVLARVAQGGIAGLQRTSLDHEAAAGRADADSTFTNLLNGVLGPDQARPAATLPSRRALPDARNIGPGPGDRPGALPGEVPAPPRPGVAPAGPAAPTATAPGALPGEQPTQDFNLAGARDAIASIESAGSGDYAAIGPQTRTGNRAYGRYQVMDFNIGPWTRQVLGRAMTPQEFLASPEAQDAVFDAKFSESVAKHGSVEDAASIWFTGRPAAQGANRADVTGSTGAQYVAAFTRALRQGVKPSQAATLGSSIIEAGTTPTAAPGPATAPPGPAVPPGPVPATQAPQGGVTTAQLAQALTNPNLSPAQQSVLSALLNQRLAAQAPTDPVSVAPGATLVDPRTGQPVFTAPAKPVSPQSVAPGGRLVGPDGQVVFEAPAAPPGPTTDIQNFEFARQNGFQGTFQDYQIAIRRANATQINTGPTGIDYGDPPAGMAWQRDETGAVKLDDRGIPVALPIGGTKQAQALENQATAATARDAAKARTADIVVQDVDRALAIVNDESPGLPVTGFGGAIAQSIPGTQAHDLFNLVQTIKSNVGFDRLSRMREESPTGGALGQVAVQEMVALQSAVGSLEQSQTREQFATNLARVKTMYADFLAKHIQGPAPDISGAPGTPDPDGWQDLGNGVRIRRKR